MLADLKTVKAWIENEPTNIRTTDSTSYIASTHLTGTSGGSASNAHRPDAMKTSTTAALGSLWGGEAEQPTTDILVGPLLELTDD